MFNNKKINALSERVSILEADANTKNERIKVLEKHLESYLQYKSKKDSDEVYLEILTESFDPNTGIELKLDWNEAAINYLKRNGFHGPDDESIVEQWVYTLFKHAQHKVLE